MIDLLYIRTHNTLESSLCLQPSVTLAVMKLYCPECKETYDDVTLDTCPNDEARLFVLEDQVEDPLIGQLIDHRFKVESKLGQGGMGAVYNAIQLSVGRKVAVKVLKQELIDREVALERFYRESKLTSELSHPNIVKLIDFGQDRERDLLYLVMELVQGIDVNDLLAKGRMRIQLAMEVVYQVCGALTEPHSLGIIHRDLKPDNLLIVPISDGTIQVKVLDFGIARALEANTQITATGMVCGTPAYMAPEQAQNQDIGPQADLYALGVMLYEMLTGMPPFDGQNSLQIMLQHIQSAPKPLSTYFPPSTLPHELEDLVNDLLAKTPESRPKSAREVRDRIEQIRRHYQLDPVRINPDLPKHELFEHLILPSIPGTRNKSNNTQALRRETDMERQAGASYSTDQRAALEIADTSLAIDEPELVTVPAHTSLSRALAEDAHHHHAPAHQHTPQPPQQDQEPAPAPTPRRAATQTSETPAAKSPIRLIAAVVIVLVLLAAGTLIALIATTPSDPTHTTPEDVIATSPTPDPIKEATELPKEEPATEPKENAKQDTEKQEENQPKEDIKEPEQTPPKEVVKADPVKTEKPATTPKKVVKSSPAKDPKPPRKIVKETITPKVIKPAPVKESVATTEPAKKPEPKVAEPVKTPPKEVKKPGLGNLFKNSNK